MQNSSARSSIDVGSVIAGTYTIEALIGRGGMGAVFLASHNRLPGKKVAIKLLHAEMEGEEILARFNREAKIASLLSHPNIVHIEDYNVTAEGMPYVVLEYLQGESLAQRVRRGPMSLEETSSLIRQVASALAAAHGKGITHRDLKPANIFVVPSEIDGVTREIAKVLDFGISKMRDGSTVKTQDSALLGTPQYMAPEQAMGQHDKVDQRTDIFALGAIVYEMLSGQAAFAGQTIPEVVFKVVYEQPVDLATRVPGLPANVLTAVQTAMAKNAEERYSSVSSFIEALTGAPVSVMRVAKVPAPEVGFAAGSNPSDSAKKPMTEREALARTMASGDHGASPLAAGDAATVHSQNGTTGTAVSGAATIQSQGGVPAPAPSSAAVSSEQSSAAPPMSTASATASSVQGASAAPAQALGTAPTVDAATPVPPRRSRGALVIGGVVVAVIATAAIAFTMRSPKKPAQVAQSTPSTHASPAVEQPSADPPPVEAPIVEAAGSAGSAAPVEAAGSAGSAAAPIPTGTDANLKKSDPKKPPNAQVHTPPAGDDDAGEADDSDLGKRVRAAEQTLRAGQWQAAQSAANAIMNAEYVRPKQKARAHVIHGIAACNRNDEEAARIDLRQLGRAPRLRQQLIAGCREAGYLNNQR
jgi:serine/threonine-protein kinase